MKKCFCSIWLCALIVIGSGCTNRANTGDEKGVLISLDKIESKDLFANDLELNAIVPIETNSSCLISTIRRIIVSGEKIYILNSYQEVLIIDAQTGQYLNRIRRIGNGPGEYSQIMDVAICEDLNQIAIYSDDMQLLFYDMDLNFIKEQHVNDELYENMTYTDGMLYFYNPMGKSDKNILAIYDLAHDKWTQTGDMTVDFYIKYEGTPLVKSKSIWYTSPLESKLSRVQGLSVEKEYNLLMENFGSKDKLHDIKNDIKSFTDYIYQENINYALTSIRETDKSIYCKSNLYSLIVVDKELNKGRYVEYLRDPCFGSCPLKYVAHDNNDNTIMLVLSAEDWVRYKDSFQIPVEILDKIPNQEINEDSNCILLFYNERTLS